MRLLGKLGNPFLLRLPEVRLSLYLALGSFVLAFAALYYADACSSSSGAALSCSS